MVKIKPLKCSKLIWNKLSPAKQKKWTRLNLAFFEEQVKLQENYPLILTSIPVIAHNLACIAVWGSKVVTK